MGLALPFTLWAVVFSINLTIPSQKSAGVGQGYAGQVVVTWTTNNNGHAESPVGPNGSSTLCSLHSMEESR
eukprot:COSAG03_NODE_23740_length_277_cov_0.876404_1_plen_70_part_01